MTITIRILTGNDTNEAKKAVLERIKKCCRRQVVWASSPSSVLRTPSPPLGEKAGMRGHRPTLHGHMLIETAIVLWNPL